MWGKGEGGMARQSESRCWHQRQPAAAADLVYAVTSADNSTIWRPLVILYVQHVCCSHDAEGCLVSHSQINIVMHVDK